MGVFSDRFGAIAKSYGAKVTTIDVPWERAVTPEEIKAVLADDAAYEYKAVLLTHNETATGVTTDAPV
jgi:alanine-glyoxylate transaminase/serine-glyoxylate transaminase/serine-pyruvate transaminase